VARLVKEDYGLVITTGGVGAEAKDHTIEALELLDPTTATAVLAKFEAGHGRHVKNAIRIGVAQVGQARVVALPGPTHEVLLALPILLENLERGTPRSELVERLAVPLRAVLSSKHHHHSNAAPPRRIGLFGGTFDPVHNGHLSLARHALHALSLDQVIFIPSGTPPSPEKTRTITDAALRVEMLRAAISGDPAFSVSTFETESSEKSYTINTLRHMAREYPPPAELFFLMGTDTAAKLERWIDLDEMRQLARFVAVPRSGQMPANVPAWVTVLETPALAWSSSDLRERARSAQSIANVTPPAVVELIHRNGLYQHV
jgi:nicotinate-nucleotide adenylyltransferase